MNTSRPVILRLALPVPLRRLFDYRVPAAFADRHLQRGMRVRVPFGRRELTGVLWDVVTQSDQPADKLLDILDLPDSASLISTSMLELLAFAAQYYLHPLGDVLSAAFPVLLRDGDAPRGEQLPAWRVTDAGRDADPAQLKRAPRQRALLQQLRSSETGLLQAELVATGYDPALLRTLAKRGWIERYTLATAYADDSHSRVTPRVGESKWPLNSAQQAAVDLVCKVMQTGTRSAAGFAPFLLEGVTGSGKTEVYLELIAAVRAQHRQALVLIPEIGLTPQTEARFRERFGDDVVVLHSALTDRQRWQGWEAARSGRAGVVLGTRSALFVSLPQPGLLIVDEEHDLSFKQQEGFRYHARDLAVRRAQIENIPVVLGSATPSLETLRNVALGRYTALQLPARANASVLPPVHLIDVRQQAMDEGLSPALLKKIAAHLQQQGQVLLFLNRRGYAPTLMCHDCGWVADCPRCDIRYTLHQKIKRLRCHHCLSEKAVPAHCPQCRSTRFVPLGQGTERIEDALNKHFPDAPVARIDRDTTRGRESMQRWVDAIRAGRYKILLGTQMLAKGHDFPDVTLAALIDVDGAFFATDFRAPERLAQLITQVAGRAGRGTRAGEVLLQTHQPEHVLLQKLVREGYRAWADAALADREAHWLPPHRSHVLLRAESADGQHAQTLLRKFRDLLRTQQTDHAIDSYGPVAAPQALRAGRYRFQLLIESDRRGLIQQLLTPLLQQAETWPEARKARWSVDVDPQEMV